MLYVAQLCEVVGLVTWIAWLAAGAMSPNEQVRVPDAIEHPGTAGEMDQLMPEPAGRGSLRVTLLAMPVPLFVKVIVNPMGDPALTEAASATLVMARLGHSTIVEAEAVMSGLALLACAVAVLL